MKNSLKQDFVATTVGLVLAMALLSVPLASAHMLDHSIHASATQGVQPMSEKEDASDEAGEASYNVEDCEAANEDVNSGEAKDLDDCVEAPK